jgi:hypothetical protein
MSDVADAGGYQDTGDTSGTGNIDNTGGKNTSPDKGSTGDKNAGTATPANEDSADAGSGDSATTPNDSSTNDMSGTKDKKDKTNTKKKSSKAKAKKKAKSSSVQQGSAGRTSSAAESKAPSVYPTGGIITKDVFASIAGKEQSVRIGKAPNAKGAYSFIFYGKDITAPVDFNATLTFEIPHKDAIGQLSETPVVFRVSGPLPGKALVQMSADLPDGAYVLFRYDAAAASGSNVAAASGSNATTAATGNVTAIQKVTAKGSVTNFFITEGGDYFIAKRAWKAQAATIAKEPQQTGKSIAVQAAPHAAPPQGGAGGSDRPGGPGGLPPYAYVIFCALIAMAGVALGFYIGRRRQKAVSSEEAPRHSMEKYTG